MNPRIKSKTVVLLRTYSMNSTSFYAYLLRALSADDLVEVSDLFPKDQINHLFIKEIDQLLRQRPNDSEDLRELSQMDLVGYIDGSLRRAGFQDFELDELTQDVITKLLLGSFFKGYRQGSLVARFKTSVSNAIATLVTRRNRQRRRSNELPGDVPSRQPVSDATITHFRAWLRLRYGPVHERVFDHRLDGGDTGELLGKPGLETSYKLKRVVREIKEAVRDFARNDPELSRMVVQAFSDEDVTMKKRFAGVGKS